MRLVKYIAIAIVNAFGTVIGIIWVAVPATLAQPALNYQLDISGRQSDTASPQSLPELYKVRDRLKLELDNLAKTRNSNPFSIEVWKQEIQQRQSQNLTQQLQDVQSRIQIEETAKIYWDESAKIADRATALGRNPNRNSATWQESQQLWQSAVNRLRQIPHDSFLNEGAIDKTIEYQGNLTMATYELQVARSIEKIKAEEEEIRERARLEQEKIERARQELARKEQEKQERARKELEGQELARQELARRELEKQEAARKEQERQELEKQEAARREQERQELARKELERLELERQELARKELERLEQEKNQQQSPQPTPELTPQATPELTPTPELSSQPTATATPSPETPVASPNSFFFAGDTNRDGKINELDEAGKEQWSLSKGALILFDDRNQGDRPKIPTWKEAKISTPRRPAMMSQVHLKLSDNFNEDTQLFIMTDPDARPHVNVFQKTGNGWQAVDISGTKPLVFSAEIVLGLEAKQFADRNWSGLVNLTATAVNNGQQIATNSIQMGVTPWMMPSHTAPVTEIQVSDRGAANSDFIAQLQRAVEPTGAQVKIIQGDRAWLQDIQKNGYVQIPDPSGTRNFNVAVKSNSERANDKPTREKDLSVFKIGTTRDENPLNQWSNGYGNLQVSPPIPGHPMGRIYYGNSGNNSFNPEVIDFIQAQRIQGPPVDIDTSWLLTRQVDEIINFIPTQTQGRFIMAIASPEAGVRMLEELAGKGYGDATINRGLSNEITVSAALNNRALIQHNLNLQQQKLNPILEKLKREFALTDDQIVQVPVMFGYSGYAWWPNAINSVPVNGNLLVSNPRGALIEGKDYTQERLRELLQPFGVNISFLDDRYYQELKGNVQSATNTVRKGEEKPFWESLPNN
jgi:protein-arginine deiminase